jgi:hypothetical protein
VNEPPPGRTAVKSPPQRSPLALHDPPLISSDSGRFGRASQAHKSSARETPKLRRPWSKLEAKRAHAEHLAAERDLLALKKQYAVQQQQAAEEQSEEVVERKEKPSPALGISFMACSPFALSWLTFAAGHTWFTICASGGACIIALTLMLTTPITDPTLPSPPASPASEQGESRHPLLDPNQDDGPQQQEVISSLSMILMGAGGVAQVLVLILLPPPVESRNSFESGLAATCAAAQVLLALAWFVSSLSHVWYCESLAKLADGRSALYRSGRQDLFDASEAELRAVFDKCKSKVHGMTACRWNVQKLKQREEDWDEAPELRADGSFCVRNLNSLPVSVSSTSETSCFGWLQRRQARGKKRIYAQVDAAGELIRQSPLKLLIVLIDLSIALDGLAASARGEALPPLSIAALCAALATLCSMSAYVRSATNDVEYADGLRWEAERRQAGLKRRSVEESLRRSLDGELDDVEPTSFASEIEEGVEQNVSKPLLEEARARLELIEQLREQREAELQHQRDEENRKRDAAEQQLAEAISMPLDDANLGDLMVALDAARSANVKNDLIHRSEKLLKDAAHRQGVRVRAEAMLQAYLKPQDDGDESDSTGSPSPSRSTSPVPAPEVEGAQEPLASAGENALVSFEAMSGGNTDSNADPGIGADADQTLSGKDQPPQLRNSASFRVRASNPLARVDVQEMDKVLDEAQAHGVNKELIEKVREVRKQIVQSQVGVQFQSTVFSVKLRHKAVISNWKQSGGDGRLARAVHAATEALKVLREETEAGPLSAALEGLTLVLSEVEGLDVPGIKVGDIDSASKLLDEVKSSVSALASAHEQMEDALDSVDDLSTHPKITRAHTLLAAAIPKAIVAHVDRDMVESAESALKDVRNKLRKAAAADERLSKAVKFLVDHLALFHAHQKSQLKVVAVPALRSAISLAKAAHVPAERVKEGADKLAEAELAQGHVEDATLRLSRASKAAVDALSRATIDPSTASNILGAAIEELHASIKNARECNADMADIMSAEQLLSTLYQSGRRTSLRMSRGSSLSVLPSVELVAQYSHITGEDQSPERSNYDA